MRPIARRRADGTRSAARGRKEKERLLAKGIKDRRNPIVTSRRPSFFVETARKVAKASRRAASRSVLSRASARDVPKRSAAKENGTSAMPVRKAEQSAPKSARSAAAADARVREAPRRRSQP